LAISPIAATIQYSMSGGALFFGPAIAVGETVTTATNRHSKTRPKESWRKENTRKIA